jgi:E3 ubiquitin-protein ligase HUWE1
MLITEIKLNKTNSKIKKINKTKMNSIYYNRNNILKNANDIFDINKNNAKNYLGNGIFNTNFDKKKKININDKFNFKRNKILAIKSSHHSLKLEKNNANLLKLQNENNLSNNNYYNNINKVFPHRINKIKKNINTFNKKILTNIISHNSVNNTSAKLNNLFERRRNLKINKKKNKNYHSISSVTDKKLNDSKFNSSVSFNIKKLKLNENDKPVNRSLNNNIFAQFIKNSEKSSDKKDNKDKNDKKKLKYFISYSSKVKKILNENMNKNLKNINNNIKNDNQLINSIKKKNNIFFTINKTIIHNMNNTFNNSSNKHYITNINNSTEEMNNDTQFSPYFPKNTIDNSSLHNGVNLKKKLISRCNLSNKYNYSINNNRFSTLKTNVNDRFGKNIKNKNKKIYK